MSLSQMKKRLQTLKYCEDPGLLETASHKSSKPLEGLECFEVLEVLSVLLSVIEKRFENSEWHEVAPLLGVQHDSPGTFLSTPWYLGGCLDNCEDLPLSDRRSNGFDPTESVYTGRNSDIGST